MIAPKLYARWNESPEYDVRSAAKSLHLHFIAYTVHATRGPMWWPRCMTWQVSWYPWDTPYVFSTVLLVVWLLWTRDGLPSSARDGLPTATGFRRRASGEGRHENYLVFRRASGSPASLVCSPPGGAGFLPPSLTSGGQGFAWRVPRAGAGAVCSERSAGPLRGPAASFFCKNSLQRGGLKRAQARNRSSPKAQ